MFYLLGAVLLVAVIAVAAVKVYKKNQATIDGDIAKAQAIRDSAAKK